jgi:hypothetical protein
VSLNASIKRREKCRGKSPANACRRAHAPASTQMTATSADPAFGGDANKRLMAISNAGDRHGRISSVYQKINEWIGSTHDINRLVHGVPTKVSTRYVLQED